MKHARLCPFLLLAVACVGSPAPIDAELQDGVIHLDHPSLRISQSVLNEALATNAVLDDGVRSVPLAECIEPVPINHEGGDMIVEDAMRNFVGGLFCEGSGRLVGEHCIYRVVYEHPNVRHRRDDDPNDHRPITVLTIPYAPSADDARAESEREEAEQPRDSILDSWRRSERPSRDDSSSDSQSEGDSSGDGGGESRSDRGSGGSGHSSQPAP